MLARRATAGRQGRAQALTPGRGGAQRSRLDLRKAKFGNAARSEPEVSLSCPGRCLNPPSPLSGTSWLLGLAVRVIVGL